MYDRVICLLLSARSPHPRPGLCHRPTRPKSSRRRLPSQRVLLRRKKSAQRTVPLRCYR